MSGWTALGPLVCLTLGALLTLVAAMAAPRVRQLAYAVALAAALAAAAAALRLAGQAPAAVLGGAFLIDPFGVVMAVLVALAAGATLLLGWDGSRYGLEFPALVLLSALGMAGLGFAGSLVTLFIGIEVLSLPLYVLCALERTPQGGEAGIKYLLLGAFSSGILLFGMALIYGASGHLRLTALAQASPGPVLEVGTALVLVGLLFKLAIVPFHMWVPDVYEGAPAPVTHLMAFGTKVGAAAALLRLLVFGFYLAPATWGPLLGYLAVLTMIVGNLLAITQVDLKRLLGYSGIANAGYLLAGIAVHSATGAMATVFFLMPYGFTVMGFFAVLRVLEGKGSNLTVPQLRGLGRRHPWVAAAMTVMLLSLAGIPLTGGFFGKLYLIQAAVFANHPGLAVGIVLGSMIGLVAYLRPLQEMYQGEGTAAARLSLPSALVMAVAAVVVVALGVFPGPAVHVANQSANFYWVQGAP